MGRTGQYAGGAAIFQCLGRFGDRAGSVDHVIVQNTGLPGYFADYVHDFGNIRLRTPLVDDRQAGVYLACQKAGPFHSP